MRIAMLVLMVVGVAGCSSAPERGNEGRVVVIAGASSGFGKGVALALAEQRANLVLAARRTELIEELARDCEARGARAIALTTDVSRERDVQRLAQAALDQFGRIDVWINMAGVGAIGRFEDIPLEDHQRVLDVNVNGVLNGSYYAMRQFRRQQSGVLINIGSVAGRVPFPYYPSYVASKHAVVGLGAALNQELRVMGERNIHVSTVNPFAADTPFFEHAANYTGAKPRNVFLDPPEKVVNAIVAATLDPKPEINVGYKANAAVASHRVARRLTQNLTAAFIHEVGIDDSPPGPYTSGSLYIPLTEGTGVDGGLRKRLAQGDLKERE